MTHADPHLSIAVITYNHAKWIRECLDGIDMQRVSFPIEVCIGDDGSSDETSAICAEYAARSHREFPVSHQVRDRNDPSRKKYESVFMPNVVQTLASCRGRYVAIVEGDDFWTEPDKLALQVQFLDENPQYSMVMHNATLVWDTPKEQAPLYVDPSDHPEYQSDRDFSVLDWPRVTFPSCSVVVRCEVARCLTESQLAFGPMWDSQILYIADTKGLIRYLSRPMACYRIHSGGCWNGPLAGDRYETLLRLFARLQRYLPNARPEVRQWLQTLFDYNYVCVADRSSSLQEFRSKISNAFPHGTNELHLNSWLAQSSANAVLKRIEETHRVRSSTSFRFGHSIVTLARAPMRGFELLRRALLD